MQKLIKKYDRPGPRYTSFPPVPFWKAAPSEDLWLQHINTGLAPHGDETGIDLYIHIPYCESLCYFCGCNKIISKDNAKGDQYVDLLKREWKLYLNKLKRETLPINSLHFGGGTPTFLAPKVLDSLLEYLSPHFTADFLGSIEVDPRTCTEEHLDVLIKHNVKRISMGVQDFNLKVQTAIHRVQSFELVQNLVQQIKKRNFNSVNFDLVYGLPYQTPETIIDSINKVIQLGPDMIAFYGYAHLPDKIKAQKLLPADAIPHGSDKRELYEAGKILFEEKGLTEIGLDHFSKSDSYLATVSKKGKLLRNFMGYTDKKSRILLGLGITSISNSSLSFIQNHHKLNDYIDDLDKNVLPISKGHTHTDDDIVLEEIIQSIMCNYFVKFKDPQKIPFWSEIKHELKDMQDDGLLHFNNADNTLQVSSIGKAFLRNISMLFDPNLRGNNQNTRFSKTI